MADPLYAGISTIYVHINMYMYVCIPVYVNVTDNNRYILSSYFRHVLRRQKKKTHGGFGRN